MKRFWVGIEGSEISSCVGSGIAYSLATRYTFRRNRATGLETRSSIGIFGGIVERRFLHISTPQKSNKDTFSRGWNTITDTSTNTSSPEQSKIEITDKMASDEDYMAFLDRANEDLSAGTSKTASSKKTEFKTMDEEVDVPGALVRATKDAWYVSDADEPFVVVALKHEGGLPDEGMCFPSLALLNGLLWHYITGPEELFFMKITC